MEPVCVEGGLAVEEFVQDDAKGPQVNTEGIQKGFWVQGFVMRNKQTRGNAQPPPARYL